MQHFINHTAFERLCADAFCNPRSRYYLIGLMAAALAVAAGAALAAIWVGLVLLVDETFKALERRLDSLAAKPQAAARHTLQLALSASLAAAPALAWFARVESSAALATAMLCALVVHTATSNATPGQLLWRLTPSGLLALLFAADAAMQGQFAGVALCALGFGYIASSTLYAARRAENARQQDAEWVRQLNMTFNPMAAAAWEIDYTRQEIVGGDRLARLLGRPVTYDDITNGACFATPGDRHLVKSAFLPAPGPMKRVAIEHDIRGADGVLLRMRHQGFLRTAPDGSPLRLTCITQPSAGADAGALTDESFLQQALAQTESTLQEQAKSLLILSNELGGGDKLPAIELDSAPHLQSEPSATLRRRIELIEQQRASIATAINDLVRNHHEAHEANLAKSQFLASMSHELRTPLNAIIGYAEMLQEDSDDSGDTETAQDLARILAAARHLLSLINEILDLSKIEAGRVDVTATSFEVEEILSDLVDTVRPLAERNFNALAFDAGASSLRANTDATKLRQCVLNLLSNACKFTRNGTIDVRLERRDLHGVPQILVTVSDTGIGISPEQMSRLFQPFVQADPSITRQYGGTGLGLTITRRLAQLLGGDVTVKSALGQGATFMLHVPVDFADAAAALGAAAAIDALQGAEDAPLVIVIEDEPDARELSARALTRAGFAVQGVGGGETGLALARSKSPALILLDIFLPDRSGWRVLQSLKHDPKTSDIPVVVLSVNEDRAHALALGAAEHIIKPADRDMLAATVMRLARARPVQPAAAQSRRQTG